MVGLTKLPDSYLETLALAAVQQNLGALSFAQPDQGFDAFLALLGDHRTHLHSVFETVGQP